MSNTTTTTAATRHAARCSAPGCGSFCREGLRCVACSTAWLEGNHHGLKIYEQALEQLTTERDAARNAAVSDHAAHIEAMEAQERKADAVIAELRLQRDGLREEVTKLTNERDDAVRCCKAMKQSSHDYSKNYHHSEVLRLEAERKAEAADAETALAITQRDRAVSDAERLARWCSYGIGAAIVGALAAIAGWVR